MKVEYLKYKILITFAIIALVAILYFTNYSCIIMSLTGIRCLGCGMTRALLSAVKLDFHGAFSQHLMFWSLPILYISFLFDGRLFKKRLLNILFYSLITAGFVLNWFIHT